VLSGHEIPAAVANGQRGTQHRIREKEGGGCQMGQHVSVSGARRKERFFFLKRNSNQHRSRKKIGKYTLRL
jgi:hypothetical protein